MVAVGGGTFMMGRDDVFPSNRSWDLIQYPAHPVSIKSFFIDRTEVTNAEYAEFVREAKHPAPPGWVNDQPPAGQEQFPVTMVSLEDAQAFARWLSARDKVTYRLPTEEEWEYAARGSNKDNIYPWGKQWIEGRANIGGTGAPRPVGSFPDGKSVWGVLDMIGNVWEWTSSEASIYPGNINLSLFNAERGVDDRGKIVLRGGSYDSKVTGDEAVTATSRLLVEKTRKHKSLGFRLVREGA